MTIEHVDDRKIWEKINTNKELPIPAYYQIKEIIKEFINDGKINDGTRIPSERELCKYFDVSRMTVRQALSQLVKEGYLYREKGVGTFVSPPKITHPMLSLVSFSEDMHKRGMTVGGKTLRKEHIKRFRKDIADILCLESDDTLLMIERLRFANDMALVLERSYFSYNRFSSLENENLDKESLYNILQRKYNIVPYKSNEVIEAGLADSYLAEKLNIDEGMPILTVTGTAFDKNGNPIEYVHSFYRGDRYKFLVELEREDK